MMIMMLLLSNKRKAKRRHLEQSRQELLEYAAQILGEHYRNRSLSDQDCLEANLKRDVESFRASRIASKNSSSMSKWTAA